MKRRVLIVDREPVFRLGLSSLLAKDRTLEVAGEAATAAEAIGVVRHHRPDLVLLGVCADATANVLAELSMLTAGNPAYAVVLLAPRTSTRRTRRLLEAGAAGYLSKQLAADALLTALHQVLRGANVVPTRVERPVIQAGGRHLSALTPSEHTVLDLVAKGLSNKQIAARLNRSEATAKVHMKNLLRKLGFSSRVEAAVWMHSHRVRSEDGTATRKAGRSR